MSWAGLAGSGWAWWDRSRWSAPNQGIGVPARNTTRRESGATPRRVLRPGTRGSVVDAEDLVEPHGNADVAAQTHSAGHQRKLRLELLVDDLLEVRARHRDDDVGFRVRVVDAVGHALAVDEQELSVAQLELDLGVQARFGAHGCTDA